MSKRIVELLVEHERAIAKLYTSCAQMFPEYSAFWEGLAGEEVRHASIIETVLQKVDDKTLFIDESRFKMRPLQISLEYVEEVTGRVNRGEVTLISALSIASAIEKSIFEENYFDIFKGDSVKFNQFLKMLQDETAAHEKKLEKMLAKVRKEKNIT